MTTNTREIRSKSPKDLPRQLTKAEAAELCQVVERTIGRWIAEGRVRATRTSTGGSGRVLIDRDSLFAAVGLVQ